MMLLGAESVGAQIFIYTASPVLAAVILGAFGWVGRRLSRQDKNIEAIHRLLDQNFGPNSGGLREQVNKIDEKVDVLAVDVATLQGREAQRRDDRGRFVS
jgi:hypothetical protein